MPKELQAGDRIQWRDTDVDPPVDRTGQVDVVLSAQYLVIDSEGKQRFVFKKDVKQ